VYSSLDRYGSFIGEAGLAVCITGLCFGAAVTIMGMIGRLWLSTVDDRLRLVPLLLVRGRGSVAILYVVVIVPPPLLALLRGGPGTIVSRRE
jgi:hypothetical protein